MRPINYWYTFLTMHIYGMFDGEIKDHSTSNLTTVVRFSLLELAVEGRLETRAVAKRRRPGWRQNQKFRWSLILECPIS